MRFLWNEIFDNNPAFMRVSRFTHAASRGQSNTDPQNLDEKGTREDGRKSIPDVFIPVRLISGFASASADPAK